MGLFWTGVGMSGSGIVVQMFSFMESNTVGVLGGLALAVVGVILSWTKAEGVV